MIVFVLYCSLLLDLMKIKIMKGFIEIKDSLSGYRQLLNLNDITSICERKKIIVTTKNFINISESYDEIKTLIQEATKNEK